MAPGHEPDDEDTREHAVPPRYPDAAPPAESSTGRGEEPAGAWSQPEQEPPADAQPTAAWPQAGQQWQQQSGQQWPESGQQWPAAQTPDQPPAQQQPAQQWQQQPAQQWQQQPQQWDGPPGWVPEQQEGTYPTSPLVAIAAVVLLIFGLFVTLIGGVGLALSGMADEFMREVRRQGVEGLEGVDISALGDAFAVVFGFVLVIGILHLLAAIGIFLHKQWARVIGMVLAVLGTLFGVLTLVAAGNVPAQMDGSEWVVPIALTLGYGFALFALIAGSSHFRRRWTR